MQASHDQLGAYVLWLKDRGLRFSAFAKASADKSANVAPAPAKTRVQVAFVGDTGFSVAEKDLLTKMIAAMQLTGVHVIVDCLADFPPFLDAHDVELIIPLGSTAAAGCPEGAMATIHPRDLLARPEDKRLAWNDLKRAMARLSP